MHKSKILESILVTLLGIVNCFKFSHPSNANVPIEVIVFGILISVTL